MIYTYQYQNQSYTVQLEPLPDGNYRVTVGDETRILVAHWMDDGSLKLELDRQKLQAYTASSGSERFVKVRNRSTKTLVVEDNRTRRKAGKAGGDAHLVAQMPGQVVDVFVNIGDFVESGQALMILEAMKMEIRVTAPHQGVVSQLFVQKGDVVERGQQLLDVESKDKEE